MRRVVPAIVLFSGAVLLTVGYFSPDMHLKLAGAIMLLVVWWVVWDMIVNH